MSCLNAEGLSICLAQTSGLGASPGVHFEGQRPGSRSAPDAHVDIGGLAPLLITLIVLVQPARAQHKADRYAAAREQMVSEYIAAEGISNPRVLEAMRTVPRHEFVRPSLQRAAYEDHALDIGHKQTISPPFAVAYMTETLDPQPTDRVLEIGTGSGYQAAILSGLVKDVYSIEIVEPLGRQAAARLKKLGYTNVTTKIGDGYLGWPEHAPFDKIIVTCSPESVPQPLIDQLKEGGRLIIPLGERYQQVFHLLEKKDGKLVEKLLRPTLFVPMTGKSEELREVQPDGSRPDIVNPGFEEAGENGRITHWHYQRRVTQATEGAAEGEHFARFENDEPGRTAHMVQGLAIDGSKLDAVTLSCQYRGHDLALGTAPHEEAALLLHFYDDRRLPIGTAVVGPWLVDSEGWVAAHKRIAVPSRAREAIVQIGLNGGVGTLDVDDVQIVPHER